MGICTLDSDDLEVDNQEEHHVGPNIAPMVGIGRSWPKFDGEAGIVCIKGDASAHTSDACAAPDPRILRGRILARLRFKGMRSLPGVRDGSRVGAGASTCGRCSMTRSSCSLPPLGGSLPWNLERHVALASSRVYQGTLPGKAVVRCRILLFRGVIGFDLLVSSGNMCSPASLLPLLQMSRGYEDKESLMRQSNNVPGSWAGFLSWNDSMEFDECSKALCPPSYHVYLLGFRYHLDSRTKRERWFSSYLLVVAWPGTEQKKGTHAGTPTIRDQLYGMNRKKETCRCNESSVLEGTWPEQMVNLSYAAMSMMRRCASVSMGDPADELEILA
ncbi:hypothetical protein HID58_083941 [Brassica napus]|uniref:Uncharacterized protein n=1 Tax=Brassica napus TaxID=3708 RepID=A0ABQ7XEN0_BRANA|nr:hypothetical protein HID58_083941 [Brassica napus]